MARPEKERAERCAKALWKDDKASKFLGFNIDEVDEGTAILSMHVMPHHCNGHGICHGGISFSLADSAFAFACNSRDQSTVGQHVFVSYLAPAYSGDRLTATARETALRGRSGIYDVHVVNQNDVAILEFRGVSRAIGGPNIKKEPAGGKE